MTPAPSPCDWKELVADMGAVHLHTIGGAGRESITRQHPAAQVSVAVPMFYPRFDLFAAVTQRTGCANLWLKLSPICLYCLNLLADPFE